MLVSNSFPLSVKYAPTTAARPAQTSHERAVPSQVHCRPKRGSGIHRWCHVSGASRHRIRLLPRRGGVRFGKDYGPDISPLLPCRNAKERIYPTGGVSSPIQRHNHRGQPNPERTPLIGRHLTQAGSGRSRCADVGWHWHNRALDRRGDGPRHVMTILDFTREHAYDLDLTTYRPGASRYIRAVTSGDAPTP